MGCNCWILTRKEHKMKRKLWLIIPISIVILSGVYYAMNITKLNVQTQYSDEDFRMITQIVKLNAPYENLLEQFGEPYKLNDNFYSVFANFIKTGNITNNLYFITVGFTDEKKIGFAKITIDDSKNVDTYQIASNGTWNKLTGPETDTSSIGSKFLQSQISYIKQGIDLDYIRYRMKEPFFEAGSGISKYYCKLYDESSGEKFTLEIGSVENYVETIHISCESKNQLAERYVLSGYKWKSAN